jgi:hypothetical protein
MAIVLAVREAFAFPNLVGTLLNFLMPIDAHGYLPLLNMERAT